MARRPCSAQKQIHKMNEFKLDNPQVSIQNSVQFLKKLTVVAVSAITYIRNIFPEAAYSIRKLNEVEVRILQGIDDEPGTRLMINWIRSAFEIVQSHYLKKMILIIKSPDVGQTVEAYTFSFSYNQEEINCYLQSEGREVELENKNSPLPKHIKEPVIALIRAVLTLTTAMGPLPGNSEISMSLELNESTPDDYKLPEYFQQSDSLGLNFPPDTLKLKLGKVETKFTKFSLSTQSLLNKPSDNEDEDDLVNASQPAYENATPHVTPTTKSAKTSIVSESLDQDLETTNLSESISSVTLKEKEYNCICECKDESKESIKCTSCSTFQHKACYKLLNDHKVINHICVNCHIPGHPTKICHDPSILNERNQKDAALYRRVLALCLDISKVSCYTLLTTFKIPRQTAQQIFDRLNIDGCLEPPTGKGNVRAVDKENLKNVLNQYFNVFTLQDTDDINMDIAVDDSLQDLVLQEPNKKRSFEEQDKENFHAQQYPAAHRKRIKYSKSGTSLKKKSY